MVGKTITVRAQAANQAAAAQVLQTALTNLGFAIIPDGNRFLMILPEKLVSTAKPGSSAIPAAPVNGPQAELLPMGMINFQNADIPQVVEIYAVLRGRKLDRSERFPAAANGGITLHTLQSPTRLTIGESVYALDTILGWSGLKVVPVGDDLVKAVPYPTPGNER